MDQNDRSSSKSDKTETKRRKKDAETFDRVHPQNESKEEVSETLPISSDRLTVATDNSNANKVPTNNDNMKTTDLIDPNIQKVRVKRRFMTHYICCIIADDDLDYTMRLFTLNKNYDKDKSTARQVINFNGASTVLFSYGIWLVFVINRSKGWSEQVLKGFLSSVFLPDLILNFRRDDKNNGAYVKSVGTLQMMPIPPRFWEWKHFCDCGDKKHPPKILDEASTISADDYIDGNNYTILYSDRRVATCCAAWLLGATMNSSRKFIYPIEMEKMVVVELTIGGEIINDDFVSKLNRMVGKTEAVFILLEKVNPDYTKMVAAIIPQVWAWLWASYYSGNTVFNGLQLTNSPQVLTWINFGKREYYEGYQVFDSTYIAVFDDDPPDYLPDVSTLTLLPDFEELDHLDRYNNLRSLSLLYVTLSVAKMATIGTLTKLDTLKLDFCQLANESLLSLSNLKLTYLSVNGCKWMNNDSWKYLQIETLKELSIRHCLNITCIENLSFVDVLDVSGCLQVTAEIIREFKNKWPYIKVIKQFEYATHPADYHMNMNWMDILNGHIDD